MIDFKILPAFPVEEPPVLPKDAFAVMCYAMFGDGDGGEWVELAAIPRVEGFEVELEQAYALVVAMRSTSPSNIVDGSYSYHEHFDKWFLNGAIWPFDPESGDDDIPASGGGYKVIYYDENSIVHPVEIDIFGNSSK